MDISGLRQRLGVTSFEEKWPGLADTIREGQEAATRALSGPSIVDLRKEEMEQFYANIQRQAQRIQEQARITIFDDKEN